VVDVSGKGIAAGPKSLLLSGAFGSLLAATEPAEFLSEANHYVWRQDWPEGFATAIQLTLDLTTGDFVLRSAGHPPAAQLHAGSGRWTVHEGYEGAVLGILENESYDAVLGRMMPGDVLLLFTDGMVEAPGRDLSVGLDRLLGEVERTVHHRQEGFAHDLVERLGARGDDCAMVVVTRATNVSAGPGAAALQQRLGGAGGAGGAGRSRT
jgi:serine phosphatase RsbU (regulator of sigma subunit)